MKKNILSKIIKIILLIISISAFVGLIWYLWPVMKELSNPEGQIAFKEKINNLGIKGFLLLFGLQLAQIVLVILPGEPLEVLAGMCYGSIGGMIFIFITVFVITAMIYFLVKKYGKKYIENTFSKEKLDKIENSKFMRNPKKVELIMTILFLIPGTPKDILVYIGALLPIKPLRFIMISTFARFPSVISSTIVGENIVKGQIISGILVYAITFVVTALIIFVINIFDKDKITKDAIKSLK